MQREGYLIEEIVEPHNMADAFDRVLRGRERKRCRAGRYLLEHRAQVIEELTQEISSGSFAPGAYHERTIEEHGKVRHLQIISMRKRIGVHAVMTVVDKHLRRRFIRTTSASIKGRGTHDLMTYIRKDLRDDPEGTQYVYQWDIRHFYESIRQELAKWCFRRVFKDERLLRILDRFTEMLEEGVSFGLRSSQATGNLVVSTLLDHRLKDWLGVRYYYRYCDDGLVLTATKEEAWRVRDVVHERLEAAGLTVKSNERVYPATEGIDILGYKIYRDHTMLRKRVKKSFAARMGAVKSRKRRRELEASFYGMAKHADAHHLYKTLTGKEMKSFKELNVSYKPEDGKKRFAGAVVSIRELVNLPIVVKDFEMGIKTAEGEDRCLVSIEVNGEMKKFFTASGEMKNILAQVAELPDGFPFATTIKTEMFGKGKTKYIFT